MVIMTWIITTAGEMEAILFQVLVGMLTLMIIPILHPAEIMGTKLVSQSIT